MPGRSAPSGVVVEVCVETTPKKVFASALAWPGWCRAGRDEEAALAALAAYRPRYAAVAREARIAFSDAATLAVIERVPGTATTQFGAPGVPAALERGALTAVEARRLVTLVTACWTVLDAVVAAAPATLRKGPRGGGRDRDAIVQHVVSSEIAYAGKLGLRLREPALGDPAVGAARTEIVTAIEAAARDAAPAAGWPPRYLARRTAWHALDHAWEIEDRSQS